MLSLPPTVRIFLCTQPTDMRKSFDSLAALVTTHLAADPLSGHLFVFASRRKDRMKILYWDRDGYALWSKRLEKGSFRLGECSGEITRAQLSLILEGIDLNSVRTQKRYSLTK